VSKSLSVLARISIW